LAAFQLSTNGVDGLVFGLLALGGLLDLQFPWNGLILSAALCLCAYAAAWELCRWLIARGYQVHDPMATTLAALVLGFAWYLSVGYDANQEASRWVEVALALGLMMEALMVCIALIGLLTSRKLRPLLELALALAAGLVPGVLLTPAVLLSGLLAGTKLALPCVVTAAILWYGLGRGHLRESEKRHGRQPVPATAAVVAAVLGVAILVLLGRTGSLSLGLLLPFSVVAVGAAVALRLAYHSFLLPAGAESDPGLQLSFLKARVLDRLPEVCALSGVLFLAASALGR
jgi:hypothetical protein